MERDLESFKSYSLGVIAKNKVHPKSPYDPKTMQSYDDWLKVSVKRFLVNYLLFTVCFPVSK